MHLSLLDKGKCGAMRFLDPGGHALGVRREFEFDRGGTLEPRFRDGREIFTVPRIAALRSVMLNHWYHHRGQLSMYLRQLDVPVPSIYGPSADENPFD